jgi:hypothetical protein
VDEGDLPLLLAHKWCAAKDRGGKYYAVTNINQHTVRMHRMLLGYPKTGVDHKNHDTLDNRRANLRPATQSQNVFNQLGVSGVRQLRSGRWHARIMHCRRMYHATFDSKDEALEWRRQKAIELFGEFTP